MLSERLRRKSPDGRAVADARLLRLEDGPGRGQRIIMARNACGLSIEIAVDRGFDIAALSFRSLQLGWHSPVQMSFPPFPHDLEAGLGILRGFDGFLVTCGLDHYGAAAGGSAETFLYPLRPKADFPLHGRIASQPARLLGYGIHDGERPEIRCEAVVRQAAVFGEVLELRRTIGLALDEPVVRVQDTVVNAGFRPTRHALLYHCNIGYPLLDASTRLTGAFGPFRDALDRDPPEPADDALEKVDILDPAPDGQGWVTVGVTNPALAGGVSLDIAYAQAALPRLAVWRCFQSGLFVLGIEPCTMPSAGPPQVLQAGERRDYAVTFRVRSPETEDGSTERLLDG